VTYNDTTNGRVVTGPLGLQETYAFATVQQARKVTRIDRAVTASTPASFSTHSYDGNGYLSSTRDWNGMVTNFTNDARGQPVSITTAAGTPQARTVTSRQTFVDYWMISPRQHSLLVAPRNGCAHKV
jgi:hypothetical protein